MIKRNDIGINMPKKATTLVFLLLYSTEYNALPTRVEKDINYNCLNCRRENISASRWCVIRGFCGFNYNRNY